MELFYDEIEIGLLVVLTKPSRSYIIGPSNPKTGTSWECVGEVTEVYDGRIDVKWENGSHNTYKGGELSPAGGGRCKSIWD